MKKTIAVFTALFMIASLLAGCGRSSDAARSVVDNGYYYEDSYYEPAYEESYYGAAAADGDYYWAEEASLSSADQPVNPPQPDDVKIIYTADLTMEATDFDAAVRAVSDLTASSGGYMEYSSMSDSGSYRTASFTVRVPSEHYRSFLDQAGTLCHITRQEESAEDISETYYDTVGRLETQRTKLARLQELLTEAENMEDIITIESAISETEETIDRLSGTLRHYDALVSYSTVSIYLREVRVLTETSEITETFGQRFVSAFRSGLSDFGEFLGDIVIALAYGWLWLVLIAGAVVAILLATRKKRRERRERKEAAPPVGVPTYSVPSGEPLPPSEEKTE